MNALFALGTLTLIGWTQSKSSFNNPHNWDKNPLALKKNDIASSYLNTLEVCPQEVPRCPGKAEPRCIQNPYSLRTRPPNQGNTEWRCVLCEESPDGTACFTLVPIETYALKRPHKQKVGVKPKIQPLTQPRSQFVGTGLQNNRPPIIPQVQQPSIQYQSPYIPPNYGYKQMPYQIMPYGQSMLNSYNMMYLQTNPYHSYAAPPQYPNPQYQSIYTY